MSGVLDSIDDMDLLRHGGMGRLFTGVRAPSTLGTFLRTFTFGHVRQLDAVASRFLAALAKNAPILPGADQCVYVDIDDTIKPPTVTPSKAQGTDTQGSKGSMRCSRSCPPHCAHLWSPGPGYVGEGPTPPGALPGSSPTH